MGWQLIERGEWAAKKPLGEGEVSIGRDGTLSFRAADLAAVGIETTCALLVDADSIRLAVRRPKEHEAARAMTVSVVTGHKNRPTERRSIRGTRGFKALGIDPRTCAGRVELKIKDDKILILNLGQFVLGDAEKNAEKDDSV